MFTRIDHVTIAVADLASAIDTYTCLGFNIHEGGCHAGRGTHNAIAFNQDDYLELVAIADRAQYRAASAAGGLVDFIEQGGGLRHIAVQSDDLAADVAAMRARGVDIGGVLEGKRRTPGGVELRWCAAVLGARHELPLLFIEHQTPLATRRTQVAGAGSHPNGVARIDRVYVAVTDVAAAAATCAKVLGMTTPPIERGNVIKADMAVFNLGPSGFTVAQPAAPGPAAEALARRGPGPFQVLLRTTGMAAAAQWMESHGLAPPARGVRNTGEEALLVPPRDACGAYVGLVGPA